jgi:hypothetical protein
MDIHMLNHLPVFVAAGSLAFAALALPLPARAAPLSITCEEQGGASQPATMTITYEGEAQGMLKVTASFGDMSLPATYEEQEIDIGGQKARQTGIRAFGTAKVRMPDKAALEACIAGKRAPDETDDVLGLMACQGTVETADAEIKADVEIAIGGAFEAGTAWVYMKRTYLEPSEGYLDGSGQPGRSITIETVPPPKCMTAEGP